MAYQPSDHEDEESWPTTPGSKSAALYKDYKRLVASIAEELQKVEVIALAYRYGLLCGTARLDVKSPAMPPGSLASWREGICSHRNAWAPFQSHLWSLGEWT